MTFLVEDKKGPIVLAESHGGLSEVDHDQIIISLAKRCRAIGCASGIAFTPSLAYCCFKNLEIDMTPRVFLSTHGWLGGTRFLWGLARLGPPMIGAQSHLFADQVEAWVKRLAIVGRNVFDLDTRYPGEVGLHEAALVSISERMSKGSLRRRNGLLPFPQWMIDAEGREAEEAERAAEEAAAAVAAEKAAAADAAAASP